MSPRVFCASRCKFGKKVELKKRTLSKGKIDMLGIREAWAPHLLERGLFSPTTAPHTTARSTTSICPRSSGSSTTLSISTAPSSPPTSRAVPQLRRRSFAQPSTAYQPRLAPERHSSPVSKRNAAQLAAMKPVVSALNAWSWYDRPPSTGSTLATAALVLNPAKPFAAASEGGQGTKRQTKANERCVDSIVVSLFAIVILSTIGALFQVCRTL